MQNSDVVQVLRYYGDIPRQMRAVSIEAERIEAEYNPLHGTAMDGMPHGAAPGDVTEMLAEKLIETGASERLQELAARTAVLKADAAAIRGQVDRLRGVYKTVLLMRYVYGYKWQDIAAEIQYSEAQAKRLRVRGVLRLAELLADMPMADEIFARARDARV